MIEPIDSVAPSGELPAEAAKGVPWRAILEGLAWVLLVAAFVIGQIAAKPDYDSMLRAALPGEKLHRSQVNESLPFVYQVEGKDEVIVIAEGEGYSGPLVVGVRARRTEDGGRLAEALMLSHKETPAFVERLHRAWKSFSICSRYALSCCSSRRSCLASDTANILLALVTAWLPQNSVALAKISRRFW